MLPLLREPVRRALDTLGVGARRRHWQHAGTFLGVLKEVSRAVEAEGVGMLAAAAAAVETVRPLSDLLAEMEDFQRGEEDEEDKGDKGDDRDKGDEGDEHVHVEVAGSNPGTNPDTGGGRGGRRGDRGGDTLEDIIARSPNKAACEAVDVPRVIVQWNRRIRNQGEMSRLASDILAAAAPLLESSDVRVRLAASEVCAHALNSEP